MDIVQALISKYKEFETRFSTKEWTPSQEEWQEHHEIQRRLLAYAVLKYVPHVDSKQIHHCVQYADSSKFTAQDFIDRLIPVISQAERAN